MFSAIGKYFRALGYLITGRVDDARKSLSANPSVVKATYDNIIGEKTKRIHQYKDAVAALITQEEKRKDDLKRTSEEVARLQQLTEGAAIMARKVVEKHNGNIEAVKQDPEYIKCQTSYNDFKSSLEEKENRCTELEQEIDGLEKSIGDHKTQLQSLMRDLEKIRQEKHEAVADIITAKEEQQIADMLSGISDDRTSEELQEMRELRSQSKAKARMSRELAGMDTKRAEEEFLQHASKAAAVDEFDALIGLSKQVESASPETPESTKIPEG